MKKVLFIMLLALVAFTSNAQVKYEPITTDTVQGAETVTFEASYTSRFVGAETFTGVVGYQYTIDNVADSCSAIGLYGSYDGTNYVLVSSDITTNTEGNFYLSDENAAFTKYALKGTCIAGDTVIFKNVIFFQKDK